jgi:hypothetical protein
MAQEHEMEAEEQDLTPDAAEALEQANKTGRFPVDIDDDDWYSKAVGKRIDKEVSKRKALQDQLLERETEAERLRRELMESRERLNKYETKADEDLDSRAKDLKARRDKALDDGDLNVYNDLNDELMEVKIELRDRVRRPKAEPAAEPEKTRPLRTAKAAEDWLKRNSDWVTADKERADRAALIEQQLFREGYTANDSETYEELDRRLSKREAAADVVDDDDEPAPPPRGSATTGVPRDTAPRTPRNAKVITRGDLQKMATFGLDPNDPKHRKAWLDRNNPI